MLTTFIIHPGITNLMSFTVIDDTTVTPTSTLRFTLILGEAFPLQSDDRFVATDGAIYRLESIEQTDRIDMLPIARGGRVSP